MWAPHLFTAPRSRVWGARGSHDRWSLFVISQDNGNLGALSIRHRDILERGSPFPQQEAVLYRPSTPVQPGRQCLDTGTGDETHAN